jgi:hypothetical protein
MRVLNEDLLIIDRAPAPTDMSIPIIFKPIYLGHVANYSIQIVFTWNLVGGPPTGTFKLQNSSDMGNPNSQGDSAKYVKVQNWTDVSNSTFTVTEAGDVMWEVENSGAEWVRAVWTPTSGNGNVTIARAKVKGI